MKSLILKCNCGASHIFSEEDVTALMAAIDKSGWRDLPDENGIIIGVCPTCDIDPANCC